MKALQYLAITAAALVCNPSLLRAQETFDEPVPPPPPSAGAPAASPLPPHFDPLDHLEAVGRTLIKIPRMIHDELRPLDHLKMLFAQGPVPPPEPGVHPVAPAVIKGHAGVAGDFAPFKFGTSARMGRALFVPKEDADPETLANAEEDLNIMMLILEKAVAQRADDDNKKMGIDLFMGGSSSTPRSLLIEGYGAMFMLRTRLALTPPPKSKTENKQKESATS